MFHVYFRKHAFAMSPMTAGALGGLVAGYSGGRSAAEGTAGSLSETGYKTRNSQVAKTLAMLAAPVGAVAGIAALNRYGHKAEPYVRRFLGSSEEAKQLYSAAAPALAGIGGGLLAGTATGALTSLRGKFSKRDKDKQKP